MKVTLADLSKRSGYSLATISRVVNGEAGVRDEVREQVEAAIRDLGYLAKRPRRMNAVIEVVLHRSSPMERLAIAPGGAIELGPQEDATAERLLTAPWRLGNDFYRRILDGALDELRQHQRKATLRVAEGLDDAHVRAALAGGAAGVLLVGEGGPGLAALIAAARRPLVLADIRHHGPCDQATSDNFDGIGQAVRHLAALGHRRVAFAGVALDWAARERAEACAFHLFRAGLELPPAWLLENDGNIERATGQIAGLLAAPGRPTALVCASDYQAMAVLRAADQCGLRVPRDLSVVGFDDLEVATLATPALTSVRTDAAGIGRQAVRLLLSHLHPPDPAQAGSVVRVPTRLVERASTAPPPG